MQRSAASGALTRVDQALAPRLMDPLRSGAIFRVPDTSVLRQSPAPRTLRAPDLASASPLLRPQPLKPPLPASAIIGTADAPFAAAKVPYMSPEAVSNRLESIFRQSPMPRVLRFYGSYRSRCRPYLRTLQRPLRPRIRFGKPQPQLNMQASLATADLQAQRALLWFLVAQLHNSFRALSYLQTLPDRR